ncbi:MAG: deoxyhypusine synthase family protein [Alphaproteobacteria bacterium]|nr:deoxyhypusine synthase family protein [Alphaproteobacteria bacterium]
MTDAPIRRFIDHHYRHFNAATVVDASKCWIEHKDAGGKVMVTLAGAMSTAELGLSLAEMIRQGKVDIISCTGANLEEDIFNLVAHDHYARVPRYRELTREQEADLRERGMNRVTDTCIPEHEAMRRIEHHIVKLWKQNGDTGVRWFPHQYMYELIRSGVLESSYQIDPKHSWMVAAAERDLPIIVPGWEDSTLGNIFVANVRLGNAPTLTAVKSGVEYMDFLIDWYRENSGGRGIGFFQIGGGIAGDFPICVVPLIHQDMQDMVPYWAWFTQISDSTTSYGSYSGAVPNEKITWGKLDVTSPSFIIESDATIVAPLVFAYVLGW